jgi:hypothetical protein
MTSKMADGDSAADGCAPRRVGSATPGSGTGSSALLVCGLGSRYLWRHVTGAVTAGPAARPPARRRTGTHLPEEGKHGPRMAADQRRR